MDLSLFFVKIDLEILFSDVLDKKKGFPDEEECPFYRVAILVIFPKGLIEGLRQKIEIWYFFVFGQNRARNVV